MSDRKEMQKRITLSELHTRAEPDGNDMIIEGYFAVFGKETELWPGAFEEIAQGAFSECIQDDIRALINHDTTLVLGRTKSGTLSLEEDEKGLKGIISINKNDSDAVNLYERVKRGDVDQCSFGFEIIEEETQFREDGTVKWIIKKVILYEVSICTFPAYQDTEVSARNNSICEGRKKQLRKQKIKIIKERYYGITNINVGE